MNKSELKSLIKEEINKILKEGFNTQSGVSKAIALYKKNPSALSGNEHIVQKLIDLKIPSSYIFNIASLKKRDTFKLNDLRTGKIEQIISSSYLEPEAELQKVRALRDFVLALDKEYGDTNWPLKFK
jgi:hypothetical protein